MHRLRVLQLLRLALLAGVLVIFATVAPGLRSQDSDGSARVDRPEPPASAAADDRAHSGAELVHFNPDDFTEEERVRIERLFKEIICKCPKENWTKTLEGCPDGCANQQKNQVRMSVKQGMSDEAILAAQEKMWGPKVLARTRAEGLVGFSVYVLPFVALVAFAVVVFAVLARWVRPSDAATASAGVRSSSGAGEAMPSAEERKWDDEIERELEEMD